MKSLFVIGAVIAFSICAQAQSGQESTSVFSKKQKFDHEGVELYSSNTEMKNFKKVGLGLMLGSSTGLLGLNAEVNLDGSEAVVIGLGTGPSYGSFLVGWKHNFEAQYLSPYTKVGYSKWFSSSGNSASDSDILKRVFTEEELKSGRFDADFLVGGIGLEYNQLEGDMAGVNFFGEIMMMEEISKSTFIPTGGVGIIYYY
jgi:hypothetical protein